MQVVRKPNLQEGASETSLAVVAPRRPASATRALQQGIVSSRMVFPDTGPHRTMEVWRAHPVDDRHELQEIENWLAVLEQRTQPAERGALLARILALLSHYRPTPNAPEVEAYIADDWAEDLGSFPMWAVEAAARNWRRTKRFRPQICEIFDLCREEASDMLKERDRLRSIVDLSGRTSHERHRVNVTRNVIRDVANSFSTTWSPS